jgi:hypothetical protein
MTKILVAGGGFEPQVRIDSTQVIDFPIGQNGENGDKGNSFIQFSFSLSQPALLSFSDTTRRIAIEHEILKGKFEKRSASDSSVP